MGTYHQYMAAGLMALAFALEAGADDQVTAKSVEGGNQYGTAVHFEKTPSDAAAKARQQEKLVMVLHVSGDFEDPQFT